MPENENNWDTPTNRASGLAQGSAMDADGDRDWLQIARQSHTASTDFMNGDLRIEWENSLRMFNNQHPAGSKYSSEAYKHRSKIFRPKTRSAVRRDEAAAAAAFFSTADLVNITAENENDPAQMANALIVGELLQYRLSRTIPWFQTVIGARQDTDVMGLCVSKQYWAYEEKVVGETYEPEIDPMTGQPMLDEYGQPRLISVPLTETVRDEPCCELREPENIRMHPGADWIDPVNTSPYLIDMVPMFVTDVKTQMSRPASKTGQPPWRELTDAAIWSAVTDEYNSARQAREGSRRDSKETASGNRDHEMTWVHHNFVRIDGEDWYYLTLGTHHLLTEPVPAEEAFPYAPRPYVIGYGTIEAHKAYPSGKVHLTEQLQREVNDVTNQRMDNVKLAMNGKNIVKRGARVDLKALRRSVPSQTILADNPETDIVFDRPPDVTGSSYQEQDRLSIEFDELAGNFSQSSVATSRNLNETVGGMNLLANSANTIGDYDLRVFTETWVTPVLRQIVKMEQMYETDTTILALAAERGQVFQRFGIDRINDQLLMQEVTVSVNVGIGATDPTGRVNRFMTGLGAISQVLGAETARTLKREEVVAEVFGALGYQDGSRFFEFGENPEVERLMQVIQELQQQLEGKQMELQAKAQIEQQKGQAKKEDRRMASAASLAEEVLRQDGVVNLERIRQAGEGGRMIMQALDRQREQRFGAGQAMSMEHFKANNAQRQQQRPN
jgi:hypothetical protein